MNLKELVQARVREIIAQREEILSAFIAKYGYEPDKIVQIVGPNFWYVRQLTSKEAETGIIE